ncbi:ead/Ea22-like family protein [Klebsiella quasipneumoniae]|uniref:ead/Ea22-like family protein n=1 Tax=Klebsiella quasipneumoniae TaxID=1463165 RepID=UPI003EF54EE3
MTTDITELVLSLKAAAEKATPGPWYVHDKPCEDGNYGIDTSDKEFLAEAVVWWGFARQSIWREEDAKYIALANPANVLALVEALEYYKSREERVTSLVRDNSKSWDELYRQVEAKGKRNVELVEALESEKRICATWRKTAEANSEKLEKAQQRIAELENNEIQEEGNQFLVVRHPGKVPVIKHPVGELEDYLRQIFKADPLATIDIVTHRYYGVGGQFVEDADEYLHEMSIKVEAE